MGAGEERRQFGTINKLPSGRYRARYADPYGRRTESGEPLRHNAPATFASKDDAREWLKAEQKLIVRTELGDADWVPPAERVAARQRRDLTFAEYADSWVANRKVRGRPLADRTSDHYRDLIDRFLNPTFGHRTLRAITPEAVADWYDTVAPDTPTYRAHAYGLMRSIMATAADPTKNNGRPRIPFNPCGIVGGGRADRATRTQLATADEVATIVANMPDRLRLMVLLADGCGLRFGELAELRRSDIGTRKRVIRVERAVVRTASKGAVAKRPKSEAGIREVPIPPHLMPEVLQHLLAHAEPGERGLLFPSSNGGHLAPSSFYGRASVLNRDGSIKRKGWGWYEARRVAGRPDLRFHDLRHGALTEAARYGATIAELMALAGHSTTQAAQRYQHASSDRLAEIARRRSEAAGWVGEG